MIDATVLSVCSSPLVTHTLSNEEKVDSLHHVVVTGGESSVYGASFNFVNSIIGAGIIGIPFALKLCGFYTGIFMLILVAFLVNESVIMLIECGLKCQKCDFEDLALHLLGPVGYYLTTFFMFIFAYGAQIAYMIIIGDSIPIVLKNSYGNNSSFYVNRTFIMILFGTVFILPLCLLKNLSSLSRTSFLSVMSDIILVIIVALNSFSEAHDEGIHSGFDGASIFNSHIFAGIGTISFAFVCQHNCFM
jgi:solute carrier family 38 (sodium-coupled neutral amino acid transporter), member 11